jgi:DNA replication and repair protein RecF
VGIFSVVSIAPEEITIISGPPEERRTFLDIILSQTSKRYLANLSRYQRVLSQRNRFLKEHRGEESSRKLTEQLSGWSDQLAELGAEIISTRDKFTKFLKGKLPDFYRQITDTEEKIEISYQISGDLNSLEPLREQIIDRLSRNLKKELIIGSTTVGPHRDELEIKIEGHDIRQFGSQGQMRSALLGLKLVAGEYISEIKGEAPLLILDEVFSELDEKRTRAVLSSMLSGGQVFIATSRRRELESVPEESSSSFYIEGGRGRRLDLR